MKVIMLTPQPFLEPRGTPISVYQRLLGLSKLGHEVDLVTYHLGDDREIPGVMIYRTPRIPFIKQIRIGPSWTKVFLDILLFFKAFWLLMTRRYDVIHTHEEAAFFALILARLFRTPHLYDMHSLLSQQLETFGFDRSSPVVRLFMALEASVVKTCNAVITIGADLQETVFKLNPNANHLRIENIAVSNNAPPSGESVAEIKQRLKLEHRIPVVYTGTFERYQGLGLLFESVAMVKESFPEVVLVMVGGKDEQIAQWQQEIKKLDLEDHVIFAGRVSLEESTKYLELAQILMSPRTEGLSVPLKIYSYLHSGKPIIATAIAAHTLVLTDEMALLVEPTSEALALGLKQLLTNPLLREELGRKAKAQAEETFSFENYTAKLDYIYQTLQPVRYKQRQLARSTEQ